MSGANSQDPIPYSKVLGHKGRIFHWPQNPKYSISG